MSINKSIQSFFETTQGDIEEAIHRIITDKKMLSQLGGGKRLRPVLSLLVFKACTEGKESKDSYERAVEGTVSIELAHTSSLIHDDIIDRDKERRGKPTLYTTDGIGTALLIGHKMLAKGFDIALKHGDEFARLYVDTWNYALSGELLEVQFNRDAFSMTDSSKEMFSLYLTIVEMKTASLFSSACKAGALEANAERAVGESFSFYGKNIGMAYQLSDDLVDFERGEFLNSVVIPLLSRINGEKVSWGTLKRRSFKKYLKDHKEDIMYFYVEEIKKYVKDAIDVLSTISISPSAYRDMLIEAPRYVVNRMLDSIGVKI